MRYSIYLCMIIFLAACSTAVKKETPEIKPMPLKPAADYYWAFRKTVNVRQSPSTAAARLFSLQDGDSVMVIENKKGWYKIRNGEQKTGWIRSDLLGTREMSVFLKAGNFIHQLKQKGIELYFDKTYHHKHIALNFPQNSWDKRSTLEAQARDIAKQYQQEVYPGDVTVHILQNGGEWKSFTVKGEINSDPVLPVIPFGKLRAVERPASGIVTLTIEDKSEHSKNALLAAAEKMAAAYPLSYKKVSIIIKSPDGNCKLWFKEDASGADHAFGKCP